MSILALCMTLLIGDVMDGLSAQNTKPNWESRWAGSTQSKGFRQAFWSTGSQRAGHD